MKNISINEFKNKLKSLAILDAILMPDWEYRYFSYDSHWDNNEEMASMRTGSGEEYFILFVNGGVIGKYYHPSYNNINHINFQSIPSIFKGFLSEDAFKLDNISNIFYKTSENNEWIFLPEIFKCNYMFLNANDYKKWAQEYYEVDLDSQVIENIFLFKKLTPENINILNPNITFEDLEEDLEEINFFMWNDP
jgi:hypothetical protein